MSSSDILKELYDKIYNKFGAIIISLPIGKYPMLSLKELDIDGDYIDDLMQCCLELFNQIDGVVMALKLTIPEVFEEQKTLIETKILGKTSEKEKNIAFKTSGVSYKAGQVSNPNLSEMPKGITRIIHLLTESYECRRTGFIVMSDELLLTASISFSYLKIALTRLLTRFNYVMMYPHRVIIDRMILETSLRKFGMFQVIDYLQSAEQHFNNQKSVEFCALSRNALHEAVKKTALIIDGEEHGFPNNCTRFKELGFLRSTILKQMKEFSGSLSACGSHPPEEKLSEDETKFLLDSLYSFLGLLPLRLSKFKKHIQELKK